jgi:hypothetical protein
MCATTLALNKAGARGGGLFRKATAEPTVIERSTIDGNAATGATSQGGGVFLEAAAVDLAASTLSGNTAAAGGGLRLARGELDATNVTVTHNRALTAAGGGLSLGPGTKARLASVSIVRNEAPGAQGAGGGVAVDQAEATLVSSVIAYNTAGTVGAPGGCAGHVASGGPNLQFPGEPGTLCTGGILVQDPLLDELGDNGGPTRTCAVRAGSPALRAATTCPPADQRGQPRATPCTAGAVE